MTAQSRIILLDDEEARAGALADSLRAHGYDTIVVAERGTVIDLAHAGQASIAIIAGEAVEDRMFLEALRHVGAGEHTPVVLVGVQQDALHDVGAVSYLPKPFHLIDLLARLRVLARLATMRDEINRRGETSSRYGVGQGPAVAAPATVDDASLLVLRGEPNLAAQAESALRQVGKVTVVDDVAAASQALNRQRFDAVVGVDPALDEFLTFCADSRANPRLYNLPILIVGEVGDADRPFRHGITEVVERRAVGSELAFRTVSLVRQQRYRHAMQEHYRQARHFATSDSLTGLYNHGFLHAHLAARVEDARLRGRALSVGYFDIFHMAQLNQTLGYIGGDFVIRQVGEMIGNLVRAEDLPARIGGDDFCVILPDTGYHDGLSVMQRIAGVINFTDFSVPRTNNPVSVSLSAGCASLQEGDTPESLIARARAEI